MSDLHVPAHPVRFVSAASLFDGHDAAINIMRRILQRQGAEVVHLGHNRSVDEVVAAAIQEDAQGVAISSYQGGHIEYFSYLVELLRERGAGHIRVYGGGGGVIVPREIELLHERGVARIFSPEDGQRLGLPGMINLMIRECDVDLAARPPASFDDLYTGDTATLARTLTLAEAGRLPADVDRTPRRTVPVLGITGTGGSGKSSLTDELVRRFRLDQEDKLRIAVLAVDPTRRKGGGALLGDRIRMNSLEGGSIFFRSMATRGADGGLPERLADVIAVLKAAGFDLVIVETPGIGQGDAGIVPFVDRSLYVMTPEFGAASQLEKIDMLDFADAVAINKFERRGGEDARRDVGRQLVRNREEFGSTWEDMPVFGTSAATFNDEGVTALYQHLRGLLLGEEATGRLPHIDRKTSAPHAAVIPPGKVRYLADVAETVRDYHDATAKAVEAARVRQHLRTARELVGLEVGQLCFLSVDGDLGLVVGRDGGLLAFLVLDHKVGAIDLDHGALEALGLGLLGAGGRLLVAGLLIGGLVSRQDRTGNGQCKNRREQLRSELHRGFSSPERRSSRRKQNGWGRNFGKMAGECSETRTMRGPTTRPPRPSNGMYQ
jgi:methylmalonyl-CoA mutase